MKDTVFILITLFFTIYALDDLPYRAGAGIWDITGPAADGMIGYFFGSLRLIVMWEVFYCLGSFFLSGFGFVLFSVVFCYLLLKSGF